MLYSAALTANTWYCVYLHSANRYPSGYKVIVTLSGSQTRNIGFGNMIVESGVTDGFAATRPGNVETTLRKQDKNFTVDLVQGARGNPDTVCLLVRFTGTINAFLTVAGVYSVPNENTSPFNIINVGTTLTSNMTIGGVTGINCSEPPITISTANLPNYAIAKFVGATRVY